MSHLKRVIALRSYLIDNGITCNNNQTKATQEAFIRALIQYNCKMNNTFHFSTNAEETIWEQMDMWNAVFPINARFILESAKSRLAEMHKELCRTGTLTSSNVYEVVFDVEHINAEGNTVPSKFVATDNTLFTDLVAYLYKELVGHHE
jgi:hypothetical protein